MEKFQTSTTRSGWFWIIAIWTGIGIFDATQTVIGMRAEGMHHAWMRLFWMSLFSWLPWLLATPFILRMGRVYSPAQLHPLKNWLWHLAACLAIGLVAAAWNGAFEVLLNPFLKDPAPGPFFTVWMIRFWHGLLGSVILYAFVLVIGHVLESREHFAQQQTETARLNEQLSKAQLQALRRQIEPHFLFNTLNGISGLIRENRNDDAVGMIAALSSMLRRAVDDSSRIEVQLSEEIEILEKYLEIQKMRFADRLRVSLEVPKELMAARVPSLILQPMVENAVKHGIAKRAQGGAVQIGAERLNGTLTIRIANDGPSLAENWRSGTGITNVRSRLESLYGNRFAFEMENRSHGGVEVRLSVPYKEN
jgi:two-component system, LytTR family, sensor kinase